MQLLIVLLGYQMEQDTMVNNITILLSSIGKQVYLVKQFLEALSNDGRVITCDCDELAAGNAVADLSYISPAIEDPGYIDWVLDLCENESITMIISLHAEELLLLEGNRKKFENIGVFLVGMPLENLRQCLDKRRIGELCDRAGLKIPPQWPCSGLEIIPEEAYPLIAKRIAGKGSRGQWQVNDPNSARMLQHELIEAQQINQYVLQTKLDGEEFGLDIVNDLNGRPVTVFVRRKFKMLNGETDIAETRDDKTLFEAGLKLGEYLQHAGLIDCDVMRCKDGDYLLDVNPRFGGGYIFSSAAGANVPLALIAWMKGKNPDSKWLTPVPNIKNARVSALQQLSCKERSMVIITDGNSMIGMGHVVRQAALASKAQRNNLSVTVFVDNQAVADFFLNESINAVVANYADKTKLRNELSTIQPAGIIIDVHEKDFTKFNWLAKHYSTSLIVSRVGFEFSYYGENIFLIGEDQEYWRTLKKIDGNNNEIKIHSGRAYMLLRDEFYKIEYKNAAERDDIILIAQGGSDPKQLTQKCLKALDLTKGIYKIKVLVGALFNDMESINKIAEKSKHQCEVLINATNVAEVMSKAAVALISGGSMRYELCSTGTPYIALAANQVQEKWNSHMAKNGVGISLGLEQEVTELQIASELDNLIANKEKRKAMSNKMISMFDGNGAKRIIELILNEGDKNGL